MAMRAPSVRLSLPECELCPDMAPELRKRGSSPRQRAYFDEFGEIGLKKAFFGYYRE
jgi:hypothetical protein